MKTKIPKLIALDLDETLLDENSKLTDQNKKALIQAQKLGTELIIATGRAYETVPKEILEFSNIQYAITGNGAAIYNTVSGTAIRRKTLPKKAAEQIIIAMQGIDIAYETFVDGKAYASRNYLEQLNTFLMDDQRINYVKDTRHPVTNIQKFIGSNELDSIAVIPRSLEVRAEALRRLKLLKDVYVTSSHIRLIEINHPDSTKASGLQFLAELIGVDQQDTAAFGNADNDAEMLQWAGCGIAMKEASAMCKAAADYITGSYRENGVAEAFHTLWGLS